MAHRYQEPIEVSVIAYPLAFKWRGRSYEILRVLRRWRERGVWWVEPPQGAQSRRRRPGVDDRYEFWRVETQSDTGRQIVDIARDMSTQGWHLDRVWD